MNLLLSLLTVLGLVSISSALAHDYTISHNCEKPGFGIDFRDDNQVVLLHRDLARFQNCLIEYMQSQAEQSMVHTNAAIEALKAQEQLKEELEANVPAELLDEARRILGHTEP